jgi:anaerobic selenocysteine-containing dehydrogenase
MSEWQKTTCVLCAINCGLEIQTEGSRITKVRPDKECPRSEGYACRKGMNIAHFQTHAERLTHPLKKVGDGFEQISWEQATEEIAAKLRELIDTHGPRCLAYMGGGGQGCHFEAAFGTRLLKALGSRYHYSALAQELTGFFYVQGEAFGRQYLHAIPDAENTDALVFWGSNAWRSHGMNRARPIISKMSKDPNKLLVVIDPCLTDTAKRADIHLRPRPGTDALLLKSIIAIILDDRIYDEDYVTDHTTGFSEVLRLCGAFDVSEALKVCELDEKEVRHLVHLLAGNRVAFRSDLGLLMGRTSTVNSYLEMIMINLLGGVGKEGGNVFVGHLVPMGTHTPLDAPNNWRTVETDIPAIVGTYPPNVMPEEIMSDKPDRLRAVLVSGSNPLRSYADTSAYEEAFKKLDLLVTIEVAQTETTALSHYVLPAKSAFEKWDASFFSWKYPEYYFHMRRPLCEFVGEPKGEPEIFTGLADKLGIVPEYPAELEELAATDRLQYGMALMNYVGENPAAAGMLPFIVAKTLGTALGSHALATLWAILARYCQTAGPQLERAGYTPSPMLGDELFEKIRTTPGDILLGVQNVENNLADNIKTDDGKVHLHIPALDEWVEEITPADELEAIESTGYPMLLIAGERTDFNANSIMRNPEWTGGTRACAMRMHPDDASELGLETGQTARIETDAGALEVPVDVCDRPARGTVIIPHGFGLVYQGQADGVNVNALAPARHRDRLAGTPLHRFVPCKVSAV